MNWNEKSQIGIEQWLKDERSREELVEKKEEERMQNDRNKTFRLEWKRNEKRIEKKENTEDKKIWKKRIILYKFLYIYPNYTTQLNPTVKQQKNYILFHKKIMNQFIRFQI